MITREDILSRFEELHDKVSNDPKVMLNTLIHYFGGVDSLWHAVHEHITDLNECDDIGDLKDYLESIRHLESSYEKAVGDVLEQEFLVSDD